MASIYSMQSYIIKEQSRVSVTAGQTLLSSHNVFWVHAHMYIVIVGCFLNCGNKLQVIQQQSFGLCDFLKQPMLIVIFQHYITNFLHLLITAQT